MDRKLRDRLKAGPLPQMNPEQMKRQYDAVYEATKDSVLGLRRALMLSGKLIRDIERDLIEVEADVAARRATDLLRLAGLSKHSFQLGGMAGEAAVSLATFVTLVANLHQGVLNQAEIVDAARQPRV